MLQYATTSVMTPSQTVSMKNAHAPRFRGFENGQARNVGRVLDGRYKLEKIIGQGGVGTVFLAQDIVEKKEVAVKILSDHTPRHKRPKRITQEVAALKEIRHPNVVKMEDSGYFEGNTYAVLEYMKGMDLKRFLKIWKTIPWEHARMIIGQACDGLSALHNKGITHLDIKPGNIFIMEDGTVKIFDFDFSDFMDDPNNNSRGIFFGTPNYISPEQFLGNRLGPRSDIFALGVTLYEILCGEAPFNAESVYGTMHKILERAPIPPSEAAQHADIPKEADAVVMKAIEKEPKNRFQTMVEMKEAIMKVRTTGGMIFSKIDAPDFDLSGPTQPIILLPSHDPSKNSRPFFAAYGDSGTFRASASF